MRVEVMLFLGFIGLTITTIGAQQQVPRFRSGTNIVPLYVTVTDDNDRLVANLVKEDFEIYDNEVQQEIVVFRNDVQPISVVVMLDTSASMTGKLKLLMAGAEQFFIRMLPGDQGRVGAFNDKVELTSEFTGDRDHLIRQTVHLNGFPFLHLVPYGDQIRPDADQCLTRQVIPASDAQYGPKPEPPRRLEQVELW